MPVCTGTTCQMKLYVAHPACSCQRASKICRGLATPNNFNTKRIRSHNRVPCHPAAADARTHRVHNVCRLPYCRVRYHTLVANRQCRGRNLCQQPSCARTWSKFNSTDHTVCCATATDPEMVFRTRTGAPRNSSTCWVSLQTAARRCCVQKPPPAAQADR